jgi:hypothetical protein
MAVSALPPGFVLDQPSDTGLPAGFVIDKPSMGEDAAKSVGSGLANATIGTLGGLGDMREAASHGVDYLGQKLGIDLSPVKTAASGLSRVVPPLGLVANAPTSADVLSTIGDPSDPLLKYQPQYETGRLLKKGAEFAPNMLLGGPEGLGARFLTNVAAPAIGSEIGEGIGGPIGGVAGALVGGIGAGSVAQKFNQMAAARNAAKAIPSAEDTLKAAGQQFKAANDMNMVVTGNVPQDIAATMRANLRKDGFSPSGQKPVFDAIDELHALGDNPAAMVNDIETIRKQLTQLKMNPDGATREAARRAIGDLNAGKASIDPAYVVRGDAPQYNKLISDAVGNYAAGKRSNTIMGKVDLADLNAGTAGSGANQDNALRQAIKQLARPQSNTNVPVAKKLGFNDQEVAAIRQAATGTAAGNTARYIGKYAPTGIVSAAGGAGLGHLVGGPVGAAIPVVGYIAKKIGDLSTKRAVSTIDSLVRSRSPLAAQVAGQLSPQIVNQLPAKSQRILQALNVAPPAAASQNQAATVAPRPAPAMPQRPTPFIPPQAAPIFAAPKPTPKPIVQPEPVPQVTAVGDGQPSRPSRAGLLNDSIRLGKYQDWTPGRIVKVGFVDGLKVEGTVPPSYPGDPAGFVLTKGDKVYRVTPHRGMEKLSAAEGKQALSDARQADGS